MLASCTDSSGAGQVVAVWDRTAGIAQRLAGQCGARAFDRVDEMVSATAPDLVIVATHPSVRARVIREALRGGAPAFLVEKPVALDSVSLRGLGALLNGHFAVANTQYRWMPHWQRLLGHVADGDLGTVRSVASSTAVALVDQGTHLIGLALAAIRAGGVSDGRMLVRASERGRTVYAGREWPEEVSAVCRFGSVEYRIDAGPAAPRVPGESNLWHHIQTTIEATDGEAWVSLTRGWREVAHGRRAVGPTAWPGDDRVAQEAMLRDLAAAVDSPELAALFPTRLAAAAGEMELLFAILDAARDGGEIDVNLDAALPA